ncbi:MAG: ACT domain-containing protein [Bacteroidales bacterium]|nr:ACT domain-containing protein [Bacteroidales bacterium]
MLNHKLTLQISELELAICRFPPDAPLPNWIGENSFSSVTRTSDELSIVCCEDRLPGNVEAERNWRMIKIKGPFEFSLTGILATLVTPLSDAGIPIFAISTYDTDYLLLKGEQLDRAIGILEHTCIIENRLQN